MNYQPYSGWAFLELLTNRGGRQKDPPPLPKVCYSYLTMMKLGYTLNSYTLPKQVPKNYMNHVTHQLSSADINIFLPKISKFCYIKKDRYRFHLDA